MLQRKIKIHSQYIKDLSFENPNSLLLASGKVPDINVMVEINSVKLERTEEEKENLRSFHEITLHVDIKATVKDLEEKEIIAFICDLKYCGAFSIDNPINYSEEELRRAVLIDGPTFLFPSAREIIARTTSSGGLLPLMLDPIDFEIMYEKQKEQQSKFN